LDVWVNATPENAPRVERALREFGFGGAGVSASLFLQPNHVIRMGLPPLRIAILTTVSGVLFGPCYQEKKMIRIDDLSIPVISLSHLRENKAASGRAKDLADVEGLPASEPRP
jgi:hypothetical protein